MAAASRISGALSQAVATVFAGGDVVTKNQPEEGRKQSRGCSPMGWHQSCASTTPAPPWVCSISCTLQGWVSWHPDSGAPIAQWSNAVGAQNLLTKQLPLTQVSAHSVV